MNFFTGKKPKLGKLDQIQCKPLYVAFPRRVSMTQLCRSLCRHNRWVERRPLCRTTLLSVTTWWSNTSRRSTLSVASLAKASASTQVFGL